MGMAVGCQVSEPEQLGAVEAEAKGNASEGSNTLWLTNEFHFIAQLPYVVSSYD